MRRTAALTALILFTVAAAAVAAQDPLSSARQLYAAARYDEALATLDGLREVTTTTMLDRRAIEQYRSLCLMALGRGLEAEAAIAAVIQTDPFYLPGENDASPRVRNAFRGVRRRLLPEIATARYAAAKATWDRKDYPEAADLFRQVLALVDDPDMQGRLADLRTLATGFADLAEAAAKPAEPPAPADAAGPAAPPRAENHIYSADDPDVTPPVPIRQDLPRVPASLLQQTRPQGMLEVVINEQGRVQEALVRGSVHPIYDSIMMSAAREWRYEPARVGTVPVKFRKRILVTVNR